MVAVIYCAIFLGDKGVNQSKVFAFCRIKRGFSQLFSSYLTGLAKITVCPGCRLAVIDEHISVDDWTEFLKSWLLILKQRAKRHFRISVATVLYRLFTHAASMSCTNLLEKKNPSKFNSHRTGLGHQHGCRFIVLRHQPGGSDVIWKPSIRLCQMIRFQFNCKVFMYQLKPGVRVLALQSLVGITLKMFG